MARRTFFSFHYEADCLRAAVVRNSGMIPGSDVAGFFDSAEWEAVKKHCDSAIKRWIRKQMNGTSVTVVLIGEHTANRPWINEEIEASWERGNGLLGVHIHSIRCPNAARGLFGVSAISSIKGANPFPHVGLENIPTYDWGLDDGRKNLGKWIEKAYNERTKIKRMEYDVGALEMKEKHRTAQMVARQFAEALTERTQPQLQRNPLGSLLYDYSASTPPQSTGRFRLPADTNSSVNITDLFKSLHEEKQPTPDYSSNADLLKRVFGQFPKK